MPQDEIRFSRAGLRAGALKVMPLAGAAVPFGIIYGYLAGQKGLSLLEVVLMSLTVFAGAAQLLAVELWGQPAPIGLLVASVLILNIRHVLMGTTLLPWFGRISARRAYGSVFFMTDETWGASIADMRAGGRDAAFLLGAGLCLYFWWALGGALGRLFGDRLPPLADYGLDFLTTAFFVALLAGLWRGRADLLPWLVSADVAIAMARYTSGTWYILGGALAGSLAGALRRAD